jgi:TetR/AcrR family transcriptional regulator
MPSNHTINVSHVNDTSLSGARTRLMEAGITLFTEKGYDGTSVREIVDLAGVSKPVLYYYFQKKQGIFEAILNDAADQFELILHDIGATPGGVLDSFIFCTIFTKGFISIRICTGWFIG